MAGFYSGNVTASDNSTIGGISSTGADLPSNFDNIIRELYAMAARYALDQGGAVTVGGTSDAITVTTNSLDAGAYVDGFAVTFIAGADNGTTTPTINIDNRGSKKLKKAVAGSETALAAADIKAGGIYRAFYRSSWDSPNGAFQIVDLNIINLDAALALKAAITDVALIDTEDDGSKNTGLLIPSGTTAQRPATPDGVQLRYNETNSEFEGYANSAWGALTKSLNTAETNETAYTSYAASTDREITELATSITTSQDNAKVLLLAVISYERHEDGVFYVKRGGTEVGSGDAAGSRTSGIIPISYDNEDASTPTHATIFMIDTVPTAGATTYTFHVRGQSQEFALNGAISATDSAIYERGASTVFLWELS